MEINRSRTAAPIKPPLLLSLAETFFAQGRFQEAAALCLQVESRTGLLKFEKLRLPIIMAKIRHLESNFDEALTYWGKAMQVIGKFPMTNGRTTRVIILSIADTLRHLGQIDTMQTSLQQAEALDKLAKPDSVQHWIAGTQHWLEYLRTLAIRSHL